MEDTKLIVYCRPNHFSTLENFRVRKKLCDVTVIAEDQHFHAHKCILAAAINYFDEYFSSENSFGSEKEILIKHVTAINMQAFIDFAYTGQITITTDNAKSFIKDANYLKLHDIQAKCEEILENNLSIQNVFENYYLALELSFTSLIEKARKLMYERLEDIMRKSEYLKLEYSSLQSILTYSSTDNIPQNMNFSHIIYEAVLKWIMNNVNERKRYLQDLLVYVNFSNLSFEYLINYFIGEEEVNIIEEQKDVMNDVIILYYKFKRQKCTKRENDIISSDNKQEHVLVINRRNAKKIEIYNPFKEKWHTVTLSEEPVDWFVGTMHEGKLYVIEGSVTEDTTPTVQIYEPRNNTWRKASPMNCKRRFPGVTATKDHLYVCGGTYEHALNTVEKYNPEIDQWKMVHSMNECRSNLVVVSFEEFLYAIGGWNGSTVVNTMERYNLQTDSWDNIESKMIQNRCLFGAAILNRKIYVCGGRSSESPRDTLNSAESYDLESKRWQSITPLNTARSGHLVVSVMEKLWAIGGCNAQGLSLNSVEIYDPKINLWSYATLMPTLNGPVTGGILFCKVWEENLAIEKEPCIINQKSNSNEKENENENKKPKSDTNKRKNKGNNQKNGQNRQAKKKTAFNKEEMSEQNKEEAKMYKKKKEIGDQKDECTEENSNSSKQKIDHDKKDGNHDCLNREETEKTDKQQNNSAVVHQNDEVIKPEDKKSKRGEHQSGNDEQTCESKHDQSPQKSSCKKPLSSALNDFSNAVNKIGS